MLYAQDTNMALQFSFLTCFKLTVSLADVQSLVLVVPGIPEKAGILTFVV